ncbi:MAG: T9SS type A sorting domain-containing protein, partial [Bacteroidota bacterium]
TFTTSALTDVAIAANGGIPTVYALNQNYPNPFNPSTKIGYDIPKVASVNVDIYDVLGRRVVSLVNGIQAPNHYLIEWNASNVSSGIYFVRIRAKSQDGSGEFNAVKKLMLMK